MSAPTRILITRPPAPGRFVDWPEPLASATAFFGAAGAGQAMLADGLALGESLAGFRNRIAALVTDAVAVAVTPGDLAEQLGLIEACGALRPTIVLWPGQPDGAEALLALAGVRAVVCGEPERGLLAAALTEAPAVYPADPVEDLDSLPRPFRDYTVHRYRLALAGLPDGPQLVARAGRGPRRWHSAAWLADDIAFCLRNYPRLGAVVLADEALNAEPERFAAYAEMLRATDRPWAARVRIADAADGEAVGDGLGATALQVAIGDPSAAEPVLARLAAAGVTVTTVPQRQPEALPSFRQAVLAAEAVSVASPPRVLIVGMHNQVYMPPWLVRAARELGYRAEAVDPWQDPRAILALTRTEPQDVVICDRGLGVTPEILARTPGQTVLYYPDPLPVDEQAPAQAFGKYAEFRAIAPAFDHVVLHDRHPWEFLLSRGHANLRGAVMLPYDPATYRDLGLERDIDLLFVGLPSDHRRQWMARLAADGVEVQWPSVWGPEFVQMLNRAKIVLNLHSLPAPNTEIRLCEALACGCFVVSEPLTQPPRLIDGEHLVIITPETAAATIRRYLADEPARRRIAAQGKAYVAEHHTARHVVAELLALIGAGRP
jgi:hypothetical protein